MLFYLISRARAHLVPCGATTFPILSNCSQGSPHCNCIRFAHALPSPSAAPPITAPRFSRRRLSSSKDAARVLLIVAQPAPPSRVGASPLPTYDTGNHSHNQHRLQTPPPPLCDLPWPPAPGNLIKFLALPASTRNALHPQATTRQRTLTNSIRLSHPSVADY